MSGRLASCGVKTGCNEQIEAVIRLPEEKISVIFGTVLDACGNPVIDAVVKLLQVVDGCKYPYP
ncbi:MAG: carboxypeptidase regulatory-like domain-containing protein, partial [Clostridium sp.]